MTYFLFRVICEALRHTPPYVYFILAYLVYVGMQYARGVTTSVYKMVGTGIIFAGLSLRGLIKYLKIFPSGFFVWLVCLLVSVSIGWIIFRGKKIAVNRGNLTLYIPPHWSTMIFFMLVFWVNYAFGVIKTISPGLQENIRFLTLLNGTSAFTLGMNLGRVLNCLSRFQS